jgi:hypothetical protein
VIGWDEEVSVLHAELQCLGGEWTISDDGLSRNGTYVAGERISRRQRLHDGDRIRVGRTTLVFAAPKRLPARATQPAALGQALPRLSQVQREILISLCRPLVSGGRFASPATNQQIAAERFLTVAAVKMQLRTMFARFDLSGLPQNQKRTRLAELAFELELISQQDLT